MLPYNSNIQHIEFDFYLLIKANLNINKLEYFTKLVYYSYNSLFICQSYFQTLYNNLIKSENRTNKTTAIQQQQQQKNTNRIYSLENNESFSDETCGVE